MGASGSGKTTLLNALNFRNTGTLKINGQVKVNGQIVNSVETISSISGYVSVELCLNKRKKIIFEKFIQVQQDDLFFGSLTVKEHLLFQVSLS